MFNVLVNERNCSDCTQNKYHISSKILMSILLKDKYVSEEEGGGGVVGGLGEIRRRHKDKYISLCKIICL